MEIYKDKSKTPAERAADLVSRMSLEDKLRQMRLLWIPESVAEKEPFDFSFLEKHADCAGAIYNYFSIPVETTRKIQKWYREHDKFGIPIAVHGEAVHGLFHENATVFPTALSMAASFNKELYRDVNRIIAQETEDAGIDMVYTPNLDITVEPRWGRVEEQYGEDPYLVSEFGTIAVNELQKKNVSACIKHYAVHSAPEGGLNLAPVHIGKREMRETMLKTFENVVKNAAPKACMPAYSEIDGVPIHASKQMVTEILRDEFGFDGVTISDYGAIEMLCSFHKVAKDKKEAGKLAIEAGVDFEAESPFGYGNEFKEAVENGEISEKLIDKAVFRLLKYKFEMGLFDADFDNVKPFSKPGQQSLDIARKMAEESVVLLKNKDNILPLDTNKKVALIGPGADLVELGGWVEQRVSKRSVSLYKALCEKIGKNNVLLQNGCGYYGGEDAEIKAAVEAASKSDVAVLILGDSSGAGGGVGGELTKSGQCVTCGEGYDSHDLMLPGRQQQLLEAVVNTGKPTVLILQSGRPYAISWAKENVDAILNAGYTGEQSGYALCNIIYGDVNPSGKLPVSFAQSVGHLPCFYYHKPSARGYYHKHGSKQNPGRDYVFSSPEPLFEFGEGLSYTKFEYSDLKITGQSNNPLKVGVSVKVKNTGDRDGKEAVLLFVSDLVRSITPPVKQLRAFDKIFLKCGEEKEVVFTLGFDDFSFLDENMRLKAEKGDFKIAVGDKSVVFVLDKDIVK